ncbi:hypothetical protein AB4144_59020, partial [Rhizobiaceae sp. 2RAB30]
ISGRATFRNEENRAIACPDPTGHPGSIMANSSSLGRLAILLAVIMMAAGKVAYGTWLGAVPSQLYVLTCFSLLTLIFLPLHARKRGQYVPGQRLLLNVSTALCFLFYF